MPVNVIDPVARSMAAQALAAIADLDFSGGGDVSNASVGINGLPIPPASTSIGSKDASGLLQPVSASNPLIVAVTGGAGVGNPTDRGGTITTGGTSQQCAPANANRTLVVVQNPASAVESLFVAVAGPASVGGAGNFAELGPGGSCNVPGTSAVTVNAATTAHRFYCTEWQ